MSYKHGVYVNEQSTSLNTPLNGTAGLQVIVGTAPVNMAVSPSGALEPKLIYSFPEAKAALGYSDDFSKYTLCQSVDASFRVFNIAPIILINALNPEKHKTDVSEKTLAVKANQAVITETISEEEIPVTGILFNTVQVAGVDGEVLTSDKYELTFDSDGTVIITLLDEVESITVSYSKLDPSAVTKDDIILALEKVREVYPRFGMTPGLILAPGWSHDANVAAAIQAKSTAINGVFTSECVLDIPADESGAVTYSNVKTVKETLGMDSEHAIVCWPMAEIGDKRYYMSALVAALIAYTDAQNSDVPYVSPSNKSLNITSTVLEDGTKVLLDQEQANVVNSFGVVTALNMNGYRCWGNNTAIYPTSTDPKDRWIPVRRFFTWRANSLVLSYFQKVDNPTNYRLIESIVDSENIIGNSFVAQGYCGGYHVEFRSDENSVTQLLDGTIKFHLYLAPFPPAEKIEFVLEFDTDAISTALTGD